MPADSLNSTAAPDQSLTPAERERRARDWTRSNLAVRIIGACAIGIILIASPLWSIFDEASAERLRLPVTYAFLAMLTAILLVLITLIFWSRPTWPRALWTIRIALVGVYALFLALIVALLLMTLDALGLKPGVDAFAVLGTGFTVTGAIFFFVGIPVAFVETLIERRSQQAKS